MALSHQQLLCRFRRGGVSGRSSSLFIEDNVVYSYGYHFPLAVRTVCRGEPTFVLNADRYSVTTGGHQAQVQRTLEPLVAIAASAFPFDVMRALA